MFCPQYPMNCITGLRNTSQNQLCPYTKVVWTNCWHSTRNMVLISPISTAKMNFAMWWIHFWKNKIQQSEYIMQQRKNMFHNINKIIVLFNNSFDQHTTYSHLRIYCIFCWNISLLNQLRSQIYFQKIWCVKVFESMYDNAFKKTWTKNVIGNIISENMCKITMGHITRT